MRPASDRSSAPSLRRPRAAGLDQPRSVAYRAAVGDTVALAHDYLTQRGGAERVVLSLLRAFPGAPLYTSMYSPGRTFPEFEQADVRTTVLDRFPPFRRDHRLALPLLAPAWSGVEVDAEVTVCSSTGWAHGARTTGRKVVYCHNPARWLYQRSQYIGGSGRPSQRLATAALNPVLRVWDRRAARSAQRYVVNSAVVRDRVRQAYGIDAEVVHPPPAYTAGHPQTPVAVEPGFWLTVSRLLPYKHVDGIVAAFGSLTGERLIVAGGGPDEQRLRASSPTNVEFLGAVDDARLAWLYGHCRGLVTASYEDFGLTPLEANVFGKPVAALAWGGHLETVVPGSTGFLFATPEPAAIAGAVREMSRTAWDSAAIAEHAGRFSEDRFVARMRAIVEEERACAR